MKSVSNKIIQQGGLISKNELDAAENKIPDVNNLVKKKKKTDLNAKSRK